MDNPTSTRFSVDLTQDIGVGNQASFTVESLGTYLSAEYDANGNPLASDIGALAYYAATNFAVSFTTTNGLTYRNAFTNSTNNVIGPAVNDASEGLSLAIWAVLGNQYTGTHNTYTVSASGSLTGDSANSTAIADANAMLTSMDNSIANQAFC